MRSGLRLRVAAGLGAALLVVGALTASTSARAATAQEAPVPTLVPTLPSELEPLTAGVSPVLWQACRGVGLAVGVVVVAGTLLGVPPEVGVPLNDLVATASGPVLGLFFEACQQIPLPDEPPDCAVDAQVPPLPSLGRPVLLAGLLASELRALEVSLAGAGLPFEGALARAADDLLGCAAGRNPEPAAPRQEPTPRSATAPVPTDAGPGSGSARGPFGPSSPAVDRPAVDRPIGADLGPPVARPVSTSRAERAGLALALVALAGLASLLWVHAGNPRPRPSRGSSGGPA